MTENMLVNKFYANYISFKIVYSVKRYQFRYAVESV